MSPNVLWACQFFQLVYKEEWSNNNKEDLERYNREILKLRDMVINLDLNIKENQNQIKKLYTQEKDISKKKNKLEISYSKEYGKCRLIAQFC